MPLSFRKSNFNLYVILEMLVTQCVMILSREFVACHSALSHLSCRASSSVFPHVDDNRHLQLCCLVDMILGTGTGSPLVAH